MARTSNSKLKNNTPPLANGSGYAHRIEWKNGGGSNLNGSAEFSQTNPRMVPAKDVLENIDGLNVAHGLEGSNGSNWFRRDGLHLEKIQRRWKNRVISKCRLMGILDNIMTMVIRLGI